MGKSITADYSIEDLKEIETRIHDREYDEFLYSGMEIN